MSGELVKSILLISPLEFRFSSTAVGAEFELQHVALSLDFRLSVTIRFSDYIF